MVRRALRVFRSARSRTVERRVFLTRATLGYEQLSLRLAPAVTVITAFAAFVALDVAALVPGLLDALILAVFAGGFVAACWWGLRGWRSPDPDAARRRMETASGAAHRPLTAASDRLALGGADPLAEAIWAAYRAQMEASARPIRASWPRLGFLSTDPYGARSGLLLLALAAAIGWGGGFEGKLTRTLSPHMTLLASGPPPGFDLWITPPDYTGRPPVYFGAASALPADPVPVPVGSKILAQIHGAHRDAVLRLGRTDVSLEAKGSGEFAVTAPAGAADTIALQADGGTLIRLAVAPVADQPPTAEWTGPAEIGPRGVLRLSYVARDDYGIVAAHIIVHHAGTSDAPVDLALDVPGGEREVKGASYQDLTGSRWAGSAVELTLEVTDAAGQSGTSAHLALNLPERHFLNPAARAVAEMRKRLMTDPGETRDVAQGLTVIALNPEPYGGDFSVFLALRAAYHGLELVRPGDSVDDIVDLLWSTAVRIEDGQAPDTLRSLRQAEEALRSALDRNAPNSEIEALTREFQQAMERYLQALAADAARNGADQQQSGDPNGQSVTADTLRQMLDRAREMARTGGRDAARAALQQLQDMLESLRAGGRPGGGKGGNGLKPLQDLARKQQDLLDRAFRAAHGGKGDPKDSAAALGRDQEALRKQLGEARQQLGGAADPETAKAFDRADRAMHDAAGALDQDQPGAALEPQGEALQRLQDAAREIAEKSGDGSGGDGTDDPLGRTGDIGRDGVKLPAAADLHHSREILDELRRRAADRARPQEERDYINRLLERF